MVHKIKAIVENYHSKIDRNGNTYWFTRVTSTKTGESISFDTPHESNTAHIMRGCLEWDDFRTIEIELPISVFNRRKRNVDYTSYMPDVKLKDMVRKHLKIRKKVA